MSTLHTPHLHEVPYSRPSTPSIHPPKIGFIGLGAVGYFMARNLAKASAMPLLVWNRTKEKSEKLVAEVGSDKVHIAQSPGQVAQESDVIITSLSNDAVVKEIYQQFVQALVNAPPTKNKIFVETSTIYPALAGELDELIYSISHARLITCPVFGAPPVADKAQLLLLMSGDYRSKQQVAYLLVPAVGRKVIDLGGNLEQAPTLKLIGNSMIIGAMEVLAESFTLAEKSGIGSNTVHGLVKDLLPAPIIVAYGEKMFLDRFDGTKGFSIEGGIKDASHVRRLTSEHNSPMPVIDVAHQHFLTARALHKTAKDNGTAKVDTLDWSAIIAGPRVSAGLDGLDSSKHTNVVREEE